jgi:hypothetical protein
MRATPIDELRQPHPDQKRIDAEAVRLLLATAPAGYAKKDGKTVDVRTFPPENATQDLQLPSR